MAPPLRIRPDSPNQGEVVPVQRRADHGLEGRSLVRGPVQREVVGTRRGDTDVIRDVQKSRIVDVVGLPEKGKERRKEDPVEPEAAQEPHAGPCPAAGRRPHARLSWIQPFQASSPLPSSTSTMKSGRSLRASEPLGHPKIEVVGFQVGFGIRHPHITDGLLRTGRSHKTGLDRGGLLMEEGHQSSWRNR